MERGFINKGLLHTDKNRLNFGQKTADFLTRVVGSWMFMLLIMFFLVFWISFNNYFWFRYLEGKPLDPFPFIILNLILSSLAAIQAPIILMSQNRATQRDRIRLDYDYNVDKKAEREIRDIKDQLKRIEKKFDGIR